MQGIESAVCAVHFESREVYRSRQHPGYTSWVSFFPGERGQWYLTCEEVTRPDPPLPQCTRRQFYAMGLPNGYDKSPYRMEMVLLESTDGLQNWQVIAHTPCRFQHSAGSFGQARTADGRFLRFVWSCYSLDESLQANEIFFTSADDGLTWVKQSPFHDAHFSSYPHRLRTLRDGTLVLCLPLAPRWGDADRPLRTAMNLDMMNEMQMTLWFSFDEGHTWDGPLPIYGGQNVSETDFVELADGHLLCINNSIFPFPGRQFIYREGCRFTPGPFEQKRAGTAPETVCLTEDNLLVGCLRPQSYFWSDDLGLTWQPLDGIPEMGPEVYQPWIHYLGDGRVACAGHLGSDDPMGFRDQQINLHLFTVVARRKTQATVLWVERDFDESAKCWKNAYTLTLTCGGAPLAGKDVECWYAVRYQPGYDSYNKSPLPERMRQGGRLLTACTDANGIAHVSLPEFDVVEDIHLSYQLVARFNPDRTDPDYQPAQSLQFELYANSRPDPPIKPEGTVPAAALDSTNGH